MVTNFDKDSTIIIVSHHLSSLKNCDRLISLKENRIDYDGSPMKFLEINNIK